RGELTNRAILIHVDELESRLIGATWPRPPSPEGIRHHHGEQSCLEHARRQTGITAAASTNARTSGGVLAFNAARSGWNSVATKKGWPSISTARTSPSPPRPTIRRGPCASKRSLAGANPYRQWYSSSTSVAPYATARREPLATETAPTC